MPSDNPTKTAAKAQAEQVVPVRSKREPGQDLYNIGVLIRREYKARVYTRGFLVVTAILNLLVIAVVFAPTLIEALSTQSQASIAVINMAGTVAGQDPTPLLDELLNSSIDSSGNLIKQDNPPFAVRTAKPEELETLRQSLRSGELGNLLVVQREPNGSLGFEYQTRESVISTNAVQVRSAASQLNTRDRLARLGIASDQQAAIFETPNFAASNIFQGGRTQEEMNAALLLSFAGISLLSSAITIYGASVGNQIAEEKNTRVMEVLINAATPFQLMIGKIVGIGLAGLTQMGSLALAGSIALFIQAPVRAAVLGPDASAGGISTNMTGFSLSLLGLILLYFLLGYLLYGTLYAAIGAMVSRQEEVGPAGSVLSFMLMAGFLAAWYATIAPQAQWVIIGSYIPFFTPTLMLARQAVGELPWWEVVLSSVIMLLSSLLCAWAAARIYRVGVLMYGQKPSLSKALQLLRSR